MDAAADSKCFGPYWFWGLLGIAVVLRFAAFNTYAAHHQDETIQYLEQAHRIVFGYGAVPWEFDHFIRSWLIPLMLVPPMALGEAIDPGGTLYLVLPRAMIAVLNFTPVVAAWFIGARISRQHAVVAMAVTAIWVECVLFSVQLLSESLAVACFMAAVALLHKQARMRSIVAAGALMAIAGLMRFQFGPAIAVYAIIVAGKDKRLWKGLLAGGIPVVIGGGLLDLAMGLTPYVWIWTNYRMNIAEGRMREIGGVSHVTYAFALLKFWKPAMFVIPFLVVMVWRQHRALLIAAVVNIAVHQLVPHKEYRYIWPSIQILLLIAAFGSVELLRSSLFGRKLADPGGVKATVAIIAAWAAMSLGLALTETYRLGWRASGEPSRLAAQAMRDPAVCGLAVPREPYTWFGYSLLHAPKPLFLIPSRGSPSLGQPGTTAPADNALLVFAADPPPGGAWVPGACRGGVRDRACLYRRPGGCRIDPANRKYLYQQTLDRFGM